MANKLNSTVRGYLNESNVTKRYLRLNEASSEYELTEKDVEAFALAAGALIKLPRITLICKKRMEGYMKHLYKVPGTSKQVIKKFVRMGEGSIIYGIGRHRFIEMARAAGAVYKINEGIDKVPMLQVGGTQDGTQDGTQGGTQDGTHRLVQELIAQNPKITRKAMAEQLNVSIRTLQRILNDIPNIHYVGTGSNGHWEIEK